MRSVRLTQGLLVLAALLAPIIGGYVASDATTIEPGGLLAAMAVGQAPILQHALLALPVSLAMVLLLVGRRVLQIPSPYVAGALVLLVGSFGPSVAISSYRAVSINAWVEWAAYAVAFLACVAGLGRRAGPLTLLGAVALGTAWIARSGVLEYLDMRRIDPTWRVFCGWNNPNAAAAMLTLGFLCALGLPRVRERSADLLLNLGVTVGGGLILCALLLTGSKGGTLLALPTGLVVFGLVAGKRSLWTYLIGITILELCAACFLFFQSIWFIGPAAALTFALVSLWPMRVHSVRLGAALVFGASMLVFFAATTPGGHGPTTSASRLAAASATQDQSSTFRINLWKSAFALVKERPVTGWGLGSYRYESARPGLVTSTVFAHNSYLQLLAEAGFGALAILLVFLIIWTWRTLRGSARLPDETRLAFGAAVGGVAAILAHCLVDSDLSTFGLGLALFLVLGAATNLAADAVAPEFIPRNTRLVGAGGVAALWLLFAYLGQGDVAKSQVRYAQGHGLPGDLASIEGFAGWDGDASYLWSLGQADPIAALKATYEMLPTPKVARRLAELEQVKGQYAEAEGALYPALAHDPNNLRTLYLLMQVERAAGEDEAAVATAQRLVAVEEKPYFKIRSLDQLVPTDTYLARIVLAEAERDPARKAGLLAACVRGLREYADVTVPEVVRATKDDPQGAYAGEHLGEAREKLGIGANAARAAAKLYQGLGNAEAAEEMDAQATALEKAIPQ